MRSGLAIFNLEYGQQDYKRRSMFANFKGGIFQWPDTKMPSFQTPIYPKEPAGVSIAEFKLRKVDISFGSVDKKTIISSEDISDAFLQKKDFGNGTILYFSDGTDLLGVKTPGYYEFYIKDSNDVEFLSNPFYINNGCSDEAYQEPEDFNVLDYDPQYYQTG